MTTNSDETSIPTPELLREIIRDVRLLFDQQLQLTQQEIKADAGLATSALQVLLSGATALLMGALLIGLALANWLHWLASPAGTDPASVPLWACQTLIAILLGISAATLILAGRAKLRALTAYQSQDSESMPGDES